MVPVLSLALIAAFSEKSDTAISISDFSLALNSIEFRIHDEFPVTAPASYDSSIYFVNPTLSESPGFALTDSLGADTISFSGTQDIQVTVGGSVFGDYFFVNFIDSFVANSMTSTAGKLTKTAPNASDRLGSVAWKSVGSAVHRRIPVEHRRPRPERGRWYVQR